MIKRYFLCLCKSKSRTQSKSFQISNIMKMFLLHSLFHSFTLSCLIITFSINLIGNMLKVEEIKRDLDINREIRLYLNQSRVSELVVFEIDIEAQRGNLNMLSSIWVPLNFKGNLSEELFLKCFPWNLKNEAFD